MRKTHIIRSLIRTILICGFILSFSYFSFSQNIEVTGGDNPPYTPESLIENIFLGNGVEVLSVSFDGDAKAAGFFNNGTSDVGLDRGIVLSTGKAQDATKTNTYPANPNAPDASDLTSGNTVTDNDLAALIPTGGLRDIAKYEITFQPYGDTLRFRYVFASEEYPRFACLNYNDVFGFFITGPNPSGGNYIAKNIAIVPETINTPVSISNIHNGNPNPPDNSPSCPPVNDQYYNDNTGSNSLAYNAYLDVFTATIVVEPCQTYTIKLAIGDGGSNLGNNNYDSAVFLEAKSFETGSLKIESVSVSLDGTIVEGCSQGELNFKVPFDVPIDYALNYQIIGTASNGIDYQLIPNNLFIPAGASSISIPIIPIEDNTPEAVESIQIDVISSPCKRDTFTFYIRENLLIEPQLRTDTTICNGNSVALDGDLNTLTPTPVTFVNNTDTIIPDRTSPFDPVSPIYSDINVIGIEPLTVVEDLVQSVCIDFQYSFVRDLDIYLIAPGGQFLELTTDNGGNGHHYTQTCFTPNATQSITDATAMAPFTGEFQPEGTWSDLWDGNNPSNGTWRLLVMDDDIKPNGASLLNNWSITFNPIYNIDYSWTPAAGLSCSDCPDPTASPAATTKYYLTVSDTYGCSEIDSVEIEVLNELPAPTITCDGSTTNSVSFSWNNISAASSYEVNIDNGAWISPNDGATAHEITGLALNQNVNIQVRGVGSCNALIGNQTCTSASCSSLTVNNSVTSALACNGDTDAEILITGSAGVAPYTYALNTSVNTTGIFTNLAAGNYNVIVNDANNCSGSTMVNISEPDALSLSTSSSSETCLGKGDGTATVTAIGGTGAYTYQWGAKAGNQTTSTAINLEGDIYNITVTDANACSNNTTVTVDAGATLSLNLTKEDLKCANTNDGKATANPSGGKSPYTFAWSDFSGQTSQTATGLGVGTFAVVVTDANGCSISDMITISAPSALSASFQSFPSSCYNSTDGRIIVTANGGTSPYTYNWSDGGAMIDTRNDLSPGTHDITVSDANACEFILNAEVFAPPSITMTMDAIALSCFESADGEANAVAGGGAGGFQYQWNDSANQTGKTATNLAAGMYIVTATDASACTIVDSILVTEPNEIISTYNIQDVSCAGGSDGAIAISSIGESGVGFQYTWSDPTSQTGAIASGLSPDTYSVTIKDSNDCEAIETDIVVGEPTAMTSSINIDNISCSGLDENELTVTASGGTGNYTYLWSDSNNQTTATANNLTTGKFYVSITDEKACLKIDSIDIVPPNPIVVTLSNVAASCNGTADGSVEAQASGGSGILTYAWNNGASTSTINNVIAGSYCVTVTDELGCFVQECNDVVEPTLIVANPSPTFIDCSGGNNAAIDISPTGGSGNYTFAWTGSNGFSANSEDINRLSTGDYTLVITDGTGCSITEEINIPNPTDILANIEMGEIQCYGDSNGSISVEVLGGVRPYQYAWSTGDSVSSINNLQAGTYVLSITDNLGCSIEEQIEVTQPASPLEVNFNITEISCHDMKDAQIIFEASGGTPKYSYSTDGIKFQPYSTQFGLAPGIYDLYTVDANGCRVDTSNVLIENPEPIEAELGPNVTIPFGEDYEIQLEVNHAIGEDMIYEWTSNEQDVLSCDDCSNPMLSSDFSTGIKIKITDENGCQAEDYQQIFIKKNRVIFVPTAFTPNRDNTNDNLLIHGKEGVNILSFKVFDRWGEMVYQKENFLINSTDAAWDGTFRGKEIRSGLYIWKAEVEFTDGFQQIFSGETTLIR